METQAAVVTEIGAPFSIETIAVADPIGHEVLVEVRASGLCHSDEHIRKEGFGFPFPTVPGHEVAGVVHAIGPDVTGFVVGDRVAATVIKSCHECVNCLTGRPNMCDYPERTSRLAGDAPRITLDGKPLHQFESLSGFAGHALIHERQLAHVPDYLPLEIAAIVGCGVATGAGAAINAADIHPGDVVAVIGCGGVGLNAISGARLCGASRIVAVDIHDGKLELARRFGATDVVNSAAVDPEEALRQIAPKGVDHAFEMIGLKPTAELAVHVVRHGGHAYILGLQAPGRTMEIRPWEDLVVGQKRIRGVNMGSTVFQRDLPIFAELYRQRRLNLDDLIGRTIRIDEISDAYAEVEKGSIARAVITSF